MTMTVRDSVLCIIGRARVPTPQGSLTGRIVAFRETITRAWRVLWMSLEDYEALPSRFQLRETVRLHGQRGTIRWGVGGKVLYDVETKQARHFRVLSNDVEPEGRLRVVKP